MMIKRSNVANRNICINDRLHLTLREWKELVKMGNHLADEIEAKKEKMPKICIHCHREYYPDEIQFHTRHCSCELTPREKQSLAAMEKLEELVRFTHFVEIAIDVEGNFYIQTKNHQGCEAVHGKTLPEVILGIEKDA